MFELREDDTFEWPVKANAPDPSRPGSYVPVKMTATFRQLSPDQLVRFDTDAELMRAALVKVTPEFKVPEGLDDDELNAMIIGKVFLLKGLVKALSDGLNGYKAKN